MVVHKFFIKNCSHCYFKYWHKVQKIPALLAPMIEMPFIKKKKAASPGNITTYVELNKDFTKIILLPKNIQSYKLVLKK